MFHSYGSGSKGLAFKPLEPQIILSKVNSLPWKVVSLMDDLRTNMVMFHNFAKISEGTWHCPSFDIQFFAFSHQSFRYTSLNSSSGTSYVHGKPMQKRDLTTNFVAQQSPSTLQRSKKYICRKRKEKGYHYPTMWGPLSYACWFIND